MKEFCEGLIFIYLNNNFEIRETFNLFMEKKLLKTNDIRPRFISSFRVQHVPSEILIVSQSFGVLYRQCYTLKLSRTIDSALLGVSDIITVDKISTRNKFSSMMIASFDSTLLHFRTFGSYRL